MTFPADYGKDAARNGASTWCCTAATPSLTEVKFLHQHNGDKRRPQGPGLRPASTSTAAATTPIAGPARRDVLEAIEQLPDRRATPRAASKLIDSDRAGAARLLDGRGRHLAPRPAHGPTSWCVIGPGAGFTTTHGYIKDLPDKLPAYQEACLRIYDAVDYAENAFNVPVVAYGGAKDPQTAGRRQHRGEAQAARTSP